VSQVQQAVARLPQEDDAEAAVRARIAAATTMKEIREAISELPAGDPAQRIANAVFDAINAMRSDLDDVRARIEAWYDDVMDRVSGVYKRRAQVWLFFFALLVTAAAGADTLHIAKTLSTDATLRSVVVADANQLVTTDKGVESVQGQLAPLNALFNPPWEDWFGGWELIGLLLTAFAVSLGAPFWFDLLNKFVNLRASGPPPEKAQPAADAAAK
jgi:hypothetical protein